jgi:hypothetical protein
MARRPAPGDDDSGPTDARKSAVPVLRDLIEERFARWDAGQAGAGGTDVDVSVSEGDDR